MAAEVFRSCELPDRKTANEPSVGKLRSVDRRSSDACSVAPLVRRSTGLRVRSVRRSVRVCPATRLCLETLRPACSCRRCSSLSARPPSRLPSDPLVCLCVCEPANECACLSAARNSELALEERASERVSQDDDATRPPDWQPVCLRAGGLAGRRASRESCRIVVNGRGKGDNHNKAAVARQRAGQPAGSYQGRLLFFG